MGKQDGWRGNFQVSAVCLSACAFAAFALLPCVAHAEDTETRPAEKAATTQTLYPMAFTVEEGVVVGTASTNIGCGSGWDCSPSPSGEISRTATVRTVGHGTNLGLQVRLRQGLLVSVHGGMATAATTGSESDFPGARTARAGQINVGLDGTWAGVSGGLLGATAFGGGPGHGTFGGTSGAQFTVRLGGANFTRADLPDDRDAPHGAFLLSFGATHPEQATFGRQARIGWLYRRWGGEIDLAVSGQQLRSITTIGVDLALTVPVVVAPGYTLEFPLGFAAGAGLALFSAGSTTSMTFHGGLRFRAGL